MEIELFIQNFTDNFDDINASELSIKTPFRDIEGWSSVKALMIISMIDDVYGVSLNGEDIINSNTIEDIYNIVIARR